MAPWRSSAAARPAGRPQGQRRHTPPARRGERRAVLYSGHIANDPRAGCPPSARTEILAAIGAGEWVRSTVRRDPRLGRDIRYQGAAGRGRRARGFLARCRDVTRAGQRRAPRPFRPRARAVAALITRNRSRFTPSRKPAASRSSRWSTSRAHAPHLIPGLRGAARRVAELRDPRHGSRSARPTSAASAPPIQPAT